MRSKFINKNSLDKGEFFTYHHLIQIYTGIILIIFFYIILFLLLFIFTVWTCKPININSVGKNESIIIKK